MFIELIPQTLLRQRSEHEFAVFVVPGNDPGEVIALWGALTGVSEVGDRNPQRGLNFIASKGNVSIGDRSDVCWWRENVPFGLYIHQG